MKRRVLRLDLETRSRINLLTQGVYVYAAHPSTDVLLVSYDFGDGVIRRWRAGDPCPQDIIDHVLAGGEIRAFNAGFERLIWWFVLAPRYGWPKPRLEQFKCTAAVARALSLPGNLDRLGVALDLKVQKDKAGKALINHFSIPRADGQFNPPEGEKFEQFHDYCDDDVRTEAAAAERMIDLPDDGWDTYHFNERINDRGLRIDRVAVRAALRLAEAAKDAADAEMALVTGGAVTACSQVGRLVEWLVSRGVAAETAQKADLEELLEDPSLPDEARTAIDLRLSVAKGSVDKLRGFLQRTSPDGRLRGAFLFHGAGTGRFSSVGAQLHNLPRPRLVFAKERLDTGVAVRAIKAGQPKLLPLLYGDELGKPLHFIADCIRSFIWAAPGHELVVADYSSIEGVYGAWFAAEDWKLTAMRELQSPEGKGKPDLYMRAAGGIYNVEPTAIGKDDERRQVGKVAELSLQYQGGVGAFRAMARGYGLSLHAVYGPVWEAADAERREKAEKRYTESLQRGHETAKTMTREAFIAADIVKVRWRAQHPRIVEAWKLLEEAAWNAVAEPGSKAYALGATFMVCGGFLWCRLPSGRCLAYGAPRVRDVEVPWADKTVEPKLREKKAAVTVLGTSGGRLLRYALYGGLTFENIIQAIACDRLVHGMKLAERAGYDPVMHVHDEPIFEVPRGFGNDAELRQLLLQHPDWCPDVPLGLGDVHRMKRYRKA